MLLDRRHILKAGTTVLLGTAAAGCLGDDTDDTDEEPEAFGIEHLRLLTEQPADYREYQELEASAYPPDAVVWFYFEPVGVTTEDAGGGQERIELTGSLTVTDPNDEEVATVSEEFHRDIPEGGTDELYLFFQFTPPVTPPVPGEYTADLSVADDLAGEEATETTTFVIEGDEDTLGIEHIRFTEDQPTGYRQFTAVDDAVYGADDDIWVYCEPKGLTVETRDGEQWVAFNASLTATGPDGDVVSSTSDDFSIEIPEEEDIEEVFVFFDLNLRRPVLGEHTVEITVQDRVHRGSVTETTSFTIEDENLALLDVFEDVVTDELDIEIEELRLRDGTVRLEYRSAYTHEDEEREFIGEMGYISGSYAGIVSAGLSAERLRSVGEDASGTEFSYTVETDLAQQLIDEEITEEEFIEEVHRSLRI